MLTDAAIKRLQPRASPYRIQDECGIPGFGVQVTPAGGKGYFLRYSHHGRRRYLALGHWPQTPLAAARNKARAALAQLDQGLDPQALPEPVVVATGTLQALLDAWAAHQRDQGRRSIDKALQDILANTPAALLTKPAHQIQPADIRALLAAIHQRGARVLANRVRSALHTAFAYGAKADHDPRRLDSPVLFGIESNPVTVIPRDVGAEHARDRVLTWAEIRALWETDTLSWPARQACRLILATGGQRPSEVVQAAWREFDLETGVWTLPAARVKNKRDHRVPLTPLALRLLAELQEALPGDWLFPYRCIAGAGQPWGISALNHAISHWHRREGTPPWKPHDLRRSFKTLGGELGISKIDRDLVQNHGQGQDVSSKHYDKYGYFPEKKAALTAWCQELECRLAGDNVIPLRRRG